MSCQNRSGSTAKSVTSTAAVIVTLRTTPAITLLFTPESQEIFGNVKCAEKDVSSWSLVPRIG